MVSLVAVNWGLGTETSSQWSTLIFPCQIFKCYSAEHLLYFQLYWLFYVILLERHLITLHILQNSVLKPTVILETKTPHLHALSADKMWTSKKVAINQVEFCILAVAANSCGLLLIARETKNMTKSKVHLLIAFGHKLCFPVPRRTF